MGKYLIIAALTALTIGQPAFADTVARSADVQYKDLDLRTDSGTRTLERRLSRAVETVCGTAARIDIVGQRKVKDCQRETKLRAAAQIDRVIALAVGDPVARVAAAGN